MASNQYFLNSRIYKNLGFKKLALKEKKKSKYELKHTKKILDRILILNGQPIINIKNKFFIYYNTEDILKNNLKFEKKIFKNLKKNIFLYEKEQDYISKILFEYILKDSFKHIKYINLELNIINLIDIKKYLQIQI